MWGPEVLQEGLHGRAVADVADAGIEPGGIPIEARQGEEPEVVQWGLGHVQGKDGFSTPLEGLQDQF